MLMEPKQNGKNSAGVVILATNKTLSPQKKQNKKTKKLQSQIKITEHKILFSSDNISGKIKSMKVALGHKEHKHHENMPIQIYRTFHLQKL